MRPAVVFVHGFMGSALNWGPVITLMRRSALAADYDFLAVDLLGHGGRRTSPLGPYKNLTLDLVAEDLYLQIKDRQPVIAVGHSFGLRPLLKMSGQHPEALSALVVEDSSPQVDQRNFEFLIGILSQTPHSFSSREEASHYFSAKFPGKLGAFLMSNIRQDPDNPRSYTWRFDFAGLKALLEDSYKNPQWREWENFPKKLAIIRGEKSDFLTKERLQEMLQRSRQKIPFVEIPGAGHWVHSDQVDLFANALTKLISDLDG